MGKFGKRIRVQQIVVAWISRWINEGHKHEDRTTYLSVYSPNVSPCHFSVTMFYHPGMPDTSFSSTALITFHSPPPLPTHIHTSLSLTPKLAKISFCLHSWGSGHLLFLLFVDPPCISSFWVLTLLKSMHFLVGISSLQSDLPCYEVAQNSDWSLGDL